MGYGVVDEPRGRVEGVAEKDALSRFDGELDALGGFDVDEGRATQDAEDGQVGVAAVEGREGDAVCTCGRRSVGDLDHGEKDVAPNAIVKEGLE